MIPSLYNLLFGIMEVISFEVRYEIKNPIITKIKHSIKMVSLLLLLNNKTDSGISDMREIVSIILLEKAKVDARRLFLYFWLIRHGITPNRVENPAIEVVIKLINIVFMVIFMFFLLKI